MTEPAPTRDDSARRPRGVPFGSPAHPLSASEAGKLGQPASVVAKRENAKTVRERLRERIEADVDRIWQAFEAGLDSDDAREKLAAAVALLAEAYGKPATTIAGDTAQPVRFIVQTAFPQLGDGDEHPVLEAGDGS